MTGAEILSLVTGAYDTVKAIGLGIINLIGKGKVDQTELAKMKHEYEMALANLDAELKRAGLWMQEKLIALEQSSGARWRPPLILASGIAIMLASLNNILASCYLPWAQPVDMTAPPMLVLAGMFLLLVTGDTELIKSAFKSKPKEGGQK